MKKLPITQWSLDDRPREKLLKKGVEALSNAELLAILIGSGNRDESAVELSKKILLKVENNLNELAKYNIKDLIKFKGIGEAKAISIISAMELSRRRDLYGALQRPKIKTSVDAYNIIKSKLTDLNIEQFWTIILRKNKVISLERISSGGLDTSIVDIRLLIKILLDKEATSFIIAHNHPSGDKKPSKNDIDLTNKVKKAGKLMNLHLLDHLIIAKDDYYSFMDEGII